MKLSSYLQIIAEASSDLTTLQKKISNPSLVSFILCKNLKSFALSDRGRKITKIIDVGANEGQFAFMARHCWNTAQIDCFEPDPNAFSQLKKNHNRDRYIQFYNYAIGSKAGELILNLGETSAQNSLLTEYGKVTKGTITVPVNMLDEIYNATEQDSSLLKIDVQGYELEVLKGANNLLKKTNFVLLEVSLADLFQGGVEIDTIWQFMKDSGYIYHSIIDQYRDPVSQIILQMDVIFERKN
jgi:FkbM family methyltransferase